MPVDTPHPKAAALLNDWKMVRAFYIGERVVKAAGTDYLIRPEGTKSSPGGIARWNAYIERAEVPDILSVTMDAMLGIATNKPAAVKLPPRMEYLIKMATPDGLPLAGLFKRTLREVLLAGRYALLSDIPKKTVNSYIVGYQAEFIKNWWEDDDGDRRLVEIVFDESHTERDSVDEFKQNDVVQYRDFTKISDGGKASIRWRKWRETGEKDELGQVDDGLIVAGGGGTLDHIPVVVVGSTDLSPDPDAIPLLPIARLARRLYWLSADYFGGLYLAAIPILKIKGAKETKGKRRVFAPGSVIELPADGDALWFAAGTEGIPAQKQAMDDVYLMALQQGARLFDIKSGVESGDTMKLRRAGQVSPLKSIVLNVGAGIEAALKNCTILMGENPDVVEFVVDPELLDVMLSPEEIIKLIEGWQKGGLPFSQFSKIMKRGNAFDPEITDEELREEIANDAHEFGNKFREANSDEVEFGTDEGD